MTYSFSYNPKLVYLINVGVPDETLNAYEGSIPKSFLEGILYQYQGDKAKARLALEDGVRAASPNYRVSAFGVEPTDKTSGAPMPTCRKILAAAETVSSSRTDFETTSLIDKAIEATTIVGDLGTTSTFDKPIEETSIEVTSTEDVLKTTLQELCSQL